MNKGTIACVYLVWNIVLWKLLP